MDASRPPAADGPRPAAGPAPPAGADEAPPLGGSWGRLYGVVLGTLAVVVVLLGLLTWVYR